MNETHKQFKQYFDFVDKRFQKIQKLDHETNVSTQDLRRELKQHIETEVTKLAIKLLNEKGFRWGKDRTKEKSTLRIAQINKEDKIELRRYRCRYYDTVFFHRWYGNTQDAITVLPDGFRGLVDKLFSMTKELDNCSVNFNVRKNVNFVIYAVSDKKIKTEKIREVHVDKSKVVLYNEDDWETDYTYQAYFDDRVYNIVLAILAKRRLVRLELEREYKKLLEKINQMVRKDYYKIMVSHKMKEAI